MKWANTSKERKPLESLAWLLFAKLKEHEAQNWRRKAREWDIFSLAKDMWW